MLTDLCWSEMYFITIGLLLNILDRHRKAVVIKHILEQRRLINIILYYII